MISIKFLSDLAKKIYENGNLLKPQTSGSAGIDLRALKVTGINGDVFDLNDNSFFLNAGERCLVTTGISTQFSEQYEIQVRSRSGLAWKNGLFVLNSPGTIDSDYRGEIGVILFNTSDKSFEIKLGDRVAQMIFASVVNDLKIDFVEDLSDTDRGTGGFGSTGKH